jgi:hypothetical protein
MHRTYIGLALGLSGMLISGCQTGRHAVVPLELTEAEIAEADVPPAALAALRELAGGQPFTEFEREDRGAYVAYEAEWRAGGVEAEATVLADGTVLGTERDLTSAQVAELPAGVRARIARLQKQGYRVEVAQRTFILYELDAARMSDDDDNANGDEEEELELLVRPDGRNAE